MNPVELIRAKRDGKELSRGDISDMVAGAVDGSIPDYQVSAWLMAVFFRGMSLDETVALTEAMIASGKTISFDDGTPKVDKHSTGGVGDKVSLILAPLVAACGLDVPMVAGRGLGHTGGTLDKLESIPGFNVKISPEQFVRNIQRDGLAIMGQTSEFVPADKLFYALRDVTGTIECMPLITASILSKKKAEGISALVLDIKVGSGAFMKNQKEAEKLAKLLVTVARKLKLPTRALLTDMNQPLGDTAGNAIEVLECLEVLQGRGPSDLRILCIELAAHMLVLGKKTSSLAAARALARKKLGPPAVSKFREMCKNQGATVDIIAQPEKLTVSRTTFSVPAKKNGFVTKMDTEKLGLLLVELGAGRRKASDTVVPTVGIRFHHKIGAAVKADIPLATVHYEPAHLRGRDIKPVIEDFQSAYEITTRHVTPPKLIKKIVDYKGK